MSTAHQIFEHNIEINNDLNYDENIVFDNGDVVKKEQVTDYDEAGASGECREEVWTLHNQQGVIYEDVLMEEENVGQNTENTLLIHNHESQNFVQIVDGQSNRVGNILVMGSVNYPEYVIKAEEHS